MTSLKVQTGIEDKSRREIAESLNRVLADTFTLYLKTHGFHWNVTGPQFLTLHALFETQYNALWDSLDELAERTRALGYPALGSAAEMAKATSLKEATSTPSARDMVRILLEDHEAICRTVRAAQSVADQAEDDATADLLTGRLANHEKFAWMLRSLLAE